MAKRMSIAIIALVVVFGGIFGFIGFRNYMIGKYFSHFQQPPVTVSDATVKNEKWQPRIDAVGDLAAVEGVEISNQVAGLIHSIDFKPGELVNKGTLLVQQDDSQERAMLPGLEAQAKLAAINLNRARKLVAKNLASRESLDTAESQLQQAESAVASEKAIIAKKAIRAPFAGLVGIRNVDPGQYLPAGTNIVSLQALDKLHADFTLPETFFGKVQIGQRVQLTVDSYPGKVFDGVLTAIDSKVNKSTHNIALQATINNPDQMLRPGMYANISVLAGRTADVLTVPKTAITYSLYGNTIYVILNKGKDKNGKPILKVEQRFVKLGDDHGTRVAITEGVKAGERVVTAGQLKLHQGATVLINNSVNVD